jgi:hypothetical protein
MYSHFDMGLRARERTEALLREAERERLARRAAALHASRNMGSRVLLRLTLVSSIAVLALAGTSAPASRPLADAQQVRTSGSNAESCWITGDLVGDANPAVVRATMCRPR